MLHHDAKLEMIIIMTTRNVMGKCQAENVSTLYTDVHKL